MERTGKLRALACLAELANWCPNQGSTWWTAYSQSVNHGFESQVNLPSSDDLCDIARVIRLQESNLDPFILEETLGLGQVQRGMIRRGVPFHQNASA
jgi:hypothetical protein